MGSLISKQLDKSFEKQMQFQTETQRLMTMRQMAVQNIMREKAMAMQLAGARDTLTWIAGFTAFLGIIAAAVYVLFFIMHQPWSILCQCLVCTQARSAHRTRDFGKAMRGGGMVARCSLQRMNFDGGGGLKVCFSANASGHVYIMEF